MSGVCCIAAGTFLTEVSAATQEPAQGRAMTAFHLEYKAIHHVPDGPDRNTRNVFTMLWTRGSVTLSPLPTST